MIYLLISNAITIIAFIIGVKIGIKVRKEEKIEIIPDIPKIINEKARVVEQEKELNKLKSGEIYNPQDRKNPDFEAHDADQKKISDYLQGIPYHLNYENTMKVYEYAKMLMEKKENRFIP